MTKYTYQILDNPTLEMLELRGAEGWSVASVQWEPGASGGVSLSADFNAFAYRVLLQRETREEEKTNIDGPAWMKDLRINEEQDWGGFSVTYRLPDEFLFLRKEDNVWGKPSPFSRYIFGTKAAAKRAAIDSPMPPGWTPKQ